MEQGVCPKWISRAPLLNGRQPFTLNTLTFFGSEIATSSLNHSRRVPFLVRSSVQTRSIIYSSIRYSP
jgi:hypothetical protein